VRQVLKEVLSLLFFLHHENGAFSILMKDIFYLPPSVDSFILTSDLLLECGIRIFLFVNYLAIKFVIVASHWYLREAMF
jgi:hypothetical protein